MPRICLSYAHYPRRPGAGFNGVYEHELSISWTDMLKALLEARGAQVEITPVGPLRPKVQFINEGNFDAALEIHFNGSANKTVAGVETLYCPGSKKGRRFAQVVHDSYAPVMHNRDRGIKEGWYRMDRPNIEDYPGDVEGDEKADYFLKYTNCPALIPEPDFMAQLGNINSRGTAACSALADGIIQYVTDRGQ